MLAQRLRFRFLDCDKLIEQRANRPLSVIIAEDGIKSFMTLEEDVLCQLECDRCVIATGGSAIYYDRAMKHLSTLGTVVYLAISLKEVLGRIPDFAARGVVMYGNVGSLAELYEQRRPHYEKYAQVTVDCDGLSIEQTVSRIIEECRL